MKFTTDTSTLSPILKKLGHAISANSVLPALSSILMQVNKGFVILTSTNLGITITCKLTCQTTGKGQMLVPFKELKNLVALEDGNIILELTPDEQIMLTCGQEGQPTDKFCLGKTMPVTDFPQLPVIETDGHEIPADFMPTLTIAAMGVGTESLRPAMQCVCVEITTNAINIVSSDGGSLYLRKIDKHDSFKNVEPCELLIPADVIPLLKGIEGTTLSYNKNHIAFSCPDLTVCCTRGDVKFPAYGAVIPVHQTNVTISHLHLTQAIEKALVVVSTVSNTGITLGIDPFNLEVLAANPDTEMNAKCVVEALMEESTVKAIALNGRLFNRALKQIKGHMLADEKLQMSIQNQNRAITLKIEGREDVIILVMPVII